MGRGSRGRLARMDRPPCQKCGSLKSLTSMGQGKKGWRCWTCKERARRDRVRAGGTPPPSWVGYQHGGDKGRYSTYRRAAIQALGGTCSRCGETDLVVLQIDHVNGGGKNDRRRNGSTAILRTIAQGERHDEFQVLCANDHLRKTAREMGWPAERWGLGTGTPTDPASPVAEAPEGGT